ncbi:dipeptide epimerase [bacterium]|nr:dipeptide epimerase [bacterium]MBU1993555.1 dipeptide epimerase [bacterium]
MKIIEIQTQIQRRALKTPFITALRTAWHVEFVRVHIICKNGFTGIGEAPATKAITGEDLEDILNSIERVKDILIFHMPEQALTLLHSTCQIANSAKAALDTALVSLVAKHQNKALYEYFGAKDLTPLQTDVTISLNNPAKMLEDAKSACANGMWILKVKLGKDIPHAIEVIQSISAELPHAKILVDANQAWHVEDCLEFIDAIKEFKIELIEQPVAASDLAGLKYITEYSNIPILADEAVFTLEDAKKVVASKSADMINIKFMKCGGVTKAREILEYAKEQNVPCMLGSMLEGPFSINVALHLALAYRDIIKYIDLDSPLLYKEPSDALDFEFSGCEISLKK